jgi:phosphate/sulfate permease
MTQRMVLGVLGLLAAALLPMTVSRFGVSLFRSQALGIVGGSLLMFMATFTREQKAARVVVPWLVVMTIATIVAFLSRKSGCEYRARRRRLNRRQNPENDRCKRTRVRMRRGDNRPMTEASCSRHFRPQVFCGR